MPTVPAKEFYVALHRHYQAANQAVLDYCEMVQQLPAENRPPLLFLAVPPIPSGPTPDVSMSIMGTGTALHGMLVQVAQGVPDVSTLLTAAAETLAADGK